MTKILNLVFGMLFFTNIVFGQLEESLSGEVVLCDEIAIGCLIIGRETVGEHTIKNNTEYHQLLQSRSPHSDCGAYQLPVIDFNEFTLIGYIGSVGGCYAPQISHKIRKNNNQYAIDIAIIQQGLCFVNYPVKLWCLIPKVEDSSTIKFYIETTRTN